MANGTKRMATLATLVAVAGVANAVTFSNVSISAAPLSNFSSYWSSGNAISFFTPMAVVSDATAPMRTGNLTIQYDADSSSMMVANVVGVALGTALQGSGTVAFTESIYNLDCNTNTVTGLIGFDSYTFVAGGPTVYSNTISLTQSTQCIRVVKTFALSALDTPVNDLAALAVVNQNIQTSPVPEPATFAALGLGVVAVMRRRRKN